MGYLNLTEKLLQISPSKQNSECLDKPNSECTDVRTTSKPNSECADGERESEPNSECLVKPRESDSLKNEGLDYQKLVIEIFNSCLFDFRRGREFPNYTAALPNDFFEADYVKCKVSESRRAAYKILVHLTSQNLNTLSFFLKNGLLPLFEGKQEEEEGGRREEGGKEDRRKEEGGKEEGRNEEGKIEEGKKEEGKRAEVRREEGGGLVTLTGWGYMAGGDSRSSYGYCGLRNLGCICYMNAMLQQFFMCEQFRYAILSADDEEKENWRKPPKDKFAEVDDNVLHQLQKMFGKKQFF